MIMQTPTEPIGHRHLDVTQARQGRTGMPVLWVLLASTIVAMVAVLLVWSSFSHRLAATSPPQVNNPAQEAKLRAVPPATSPPARP
jgi:hypothetical protein